MSRAHRVRLPGPKEPRDLRDRKERWVLRDRLASRPARRDPRATKEQLVRVARKVHQEEAAHKAPEDLKGPQGSRGLKVCKECPDLRERRGRLAFKDCSDLREGKGQSALKDRRDRRAKPAQRDSISTQHQPRVLPSELAQRASRSVADLLIR